MTDIVSQEMSLIIALAVTADTCRSLYALVNIIVFSASFFYAMLCYKRRKLNI
jgi:hypothetical protein